MATPHVAGSAALYLASHPGATPAQVLAGLKSGGEAVGAGHSDPSGKHPEPVVSAKAAYSSPALPPGPTDFSLSSNVSSLSFAAGGSGTFTISVIPSGSFTTA